MYYPFYILWLVLVDMIGLVSDTSVVILVLDMLVLDMLILDMLIQIDKLVLEILLIEIDN